MKRSFLNGIKSVVRNTKYEYEYEHKYKYNPNTNTDSMDVMCLPVFQGVKELTSSSIFIFKFFVYAVFFSYFYPTSNSQSK